MYPSQTYSYQLTNDSTLIQGARRLLYEELFVPLQLPDTTQEELKIAGEEFYFVATKDEEVVGVMVVVTEGDHIELHHAATRSALRGEGIGQELWKMVHEFAVTRGFTRMELESRNTAVSFWESVGFIQSTDEWIERKNFVEHGIRHKTMHRDLP